MIKAVNMKDRDSNALFFVHTPTSTDSSCWKIRKLLQHVDDWHILWFPSSICTYLSLWVSFFMSIYDHVFIYGVCRTYSRSYLCCLNEIWTNDHVFVLCLYTVFAWHIQGRVYAVIAVSVNKDFVIDLKWSISSVLSLCMVNSVCLWRRTCLLWMSQLVIQGIFRYRLGFLLILSEGTLIYHGHPS